MFDHRVLLDDIIRDDCSLHLHLRYGTMRLILSLNSKFGILSRRGK